MSFFIFPFELNFLAGVNTKMLMAAFGIPLFLVKAVQSKIRPLDDGLLKIILLGFVASMLCLFSVTYNNTNDYTYATYFVSMFVWFGGGYVVYEYIKAVDGKATVPIICNYMIAVGVFQCVMALLIDRYPGVENFVNSISSGVGFGKGFQDLGSRLYGLGAMLDVAGQRFSCILVMISFLLIRCRNKKAIYIYMTSFAFITVVGNMISRTTTVGAGLGLFIISLSFFSTRIRNSLLTIPFLLTSIVGVLLVIFLFNTNESFEGQFRFGFEGFFSLFEKGHWETHSNNILESMYRWPDNAKTWIIGDGRFNNPSSDPYYIGYMWKGFYMGTDVGFLRFIYYGGLVFLATFSLYFIQIGVYCAKKLPEYKWLMWSLVLINFIGWLKVSSDIFMILVPFILLSWLGNGQEEEYTVLEKRVTTN